MAEPIKYESALPALLTQLLGNTQKTSGGTSTTASTANTDPLMQIFQQQANSSTPEGMAALIQQVFQQGAQAVPELTGAYANARGARSSNNSGLALSLAELNKTLAGQAAGMVTGQQQAASQTAAQIANASKGTTSTTSGQTQQTGNPKAALLAGAGGTLLNAADKFGLTKKLSGLLSGEGASNIAGALDFNPAGNVGGIASMIDNYDLQNVSTSLPFSGNGDQFGNYGDVFGTISDTGNNLLSGAGDILSGAGDFASGAIDTIASGAGDLWDSISGAFDGWFADGGLVDVKKMNAYADGGQVRNRNNMGAPASRGMGQGALNAKPSTVTDVVARPSTSAAPAAVNPRAALLEQLKAQMEKEGKQGGASDSASNAAAGMNPGNSFQNANALGAFANTAMGLMGPAMLGPLGMLAGPAMAAITGTPSLQALAVQQAVAQLGTALGASTGGGAKAGDFSGNVGPGAQSTPGAPGSYGMSTAPGAGETDYGWGAGTAALGGQDSPSFGGGVGGDNGYGGYGASGNGGFGGGYGSTGGRGNDGHGDGNGSNGNTGAGASSGSSAGGNYRHGGEVNGPGTGTSDSIRAHLSDGEFVISKDVVDAVGVDFFEQLQNQFHTPAAMQQLQRSK